MKFSCDSCGAQYTIDEAKLGARGAKVRCKKCSYVIILRPPGYKPKAKTSSPSPTSTTASPSVETAASLGTGDVVFPNEDMTMDRLASSSDSGDEAEDETVAALGGSADLPPLVQEARGRARSSGQSWASEVGPANGGSSPFSIRGSGGSLDVAPRSADPSDWRRASSPAAHALMSSGGLQQGAPESGGDDEAPEARTMVESHPLAVSTSNEAGIEEDPSGDLRDALGSSESPLAARGAHGVARVSNAFDGFASERPTGVGEAGEPGEVGHAGTADESVGFGERESGESGEAGRDEADSRAMIDDEDPTKFGEPPRPRDRVPLNGSHRSAEANDALVETDLVRRERPSVQPASMAGGAGGGAGLSEHDADFDGGAKARREATLAALAASAADRVASAPDDASGADAYGESPANPELSAALDAMFGPMGQSDGEIQGPLGSLVGSGASLNSGISSPSGASVVSDDPALRPKADLKSIEKPMFDFGAVRASAAKAQRPAAEWYLAIEDERVGPLTLEDIRARILGPDVDENTLCWKQGMADWLSIRLVDEVKDLCPPEEERRNTVVVAVGDASSPASKPDEDDAAALDALKASEPHRITRSSPPVKPGTESGSASAEAEAEASSRESPSRDASTRDGEPSWRPSAARALASLAAEEMAAPAPASAAKPRAPGTGDLPPSRDALERLLTKPAGPEPASDAAVMFGAMEKSSSFVRPLPRAAEAVTSMPLRDPLLKGMRGLRGQLLMAAVILGVAIIAGAVLIATRQAPEVPARSEVAANPEMGKPVSARDRLDRPPVRSTTPGPSVPTPSSEPTPAPAAQETAPVPSTATVDTAASAAVAPAPGSAAGSTSGSTSPSPGPGGGGDEGASARASSSRTSERRDRRSDSDSDSRDRASSRQRVRTRSSARNTSRSASRQTRRRAREDDAREASRTSRRRATSSSSGNEEDDLLGAARRSRGTSDTDSSLPRQLDDSDVLGGIRKYRKDVQTCLEKQASADPSVQGRMIIKMVIQRNGQPTRVSVQPERFAASVAGKCMQRSVARWRFPRFSGPSMPVDFPVLVRGQ